jgi:hypothetical protein
VEPGAISDVRWSGVGGAGIPTHPPSLRELVGRSRAERGSLAGWEVTPKMAVGDNYPLVMTNIAIENDHL